MNDWADAYLLKKEQEKYQMSFEFDYDQLRDRELNDYLEGIRKTPLTSQDDPFFDTMEDYEDSRDTTPYNREQYEWND